MLERAAQWSLESVGETSPHPNACCVLADAGGQLLTHASQRAHGSMACEVAAVGRCAPGAARGGTAYLNLETGDCHGEPAAVRALIASGVERVVIGIRHPLLHWRGRSVRALREAGVAVHVLGESPCAAPADLERRVYGACLAANDALLVRAHAGRPMSVLKYAMTLDGKIATHTGHASWVSSPESRERVFEQRAASDAVIVGGNTVRRDNPRLTTRRDSGHMPARVVLTRTLDLPSKANLWDTTLAPTIVMTQRGARKSFQQELAARGVEVVEFDFLEPKAVTAYLHDRGFLRLFWECGGTLSAPAIQAGIIDKAIAFVAPKIIGGTHAPTPVGDLGFVEMTQAVAVVDGQWQASGPDIMLTGYLASTVPSLAALDEALDAALAVRQARALSGADASPSGGDDDKHGPSRPSAIRKGRQGRTAPGSRGVAEFYKACDEWGALSNFSPHPISMPEGGGRSREWRSVEHYYQAQKFAGVAGAEEVVEAIWVAASPEEAARIGRRTQRQRPEFVRADWDSAKVAVMRSALWAKYSAHAGPREMLLATATGGPDGGPLEVVEGSPHDAFWGRGREGAGANQLGRLLMEIREALLAGRGPPKGVVEEQVATRGEETARAL